MAKNKKLKKFKYGGGADMGAPERASQRAERGYGGVGKGTGGRQPQAQYQGAKPSEKARQAMQAQRERARARISPSTTPAGKAIAGTIGAITGVPYFGYKIGQRMVDYSPMAFGVPNSTKAKKDKTSKDRDRYRDGPPPVQPVIAGPIPINQPMNQLIPIPRIRPKVSPTGVFNYGFKKGGLLRQGKPKLAKKGWK